MRKKTMWKWMLSYLFVLVLPLAFGIIIYVYSMYTIKEEAEEIQYRVVSRSADAMEDLLDSLKQMGKAMVSNEEILDLGQVKDGDFNPVQLWNFQKVNDMLMNYCVSNDEIASVYLYLPHSQYLIGTGNLYYTHNSKMIEGSLQISQEDFETMMSRPGNEYVHVFGGIRNPVCLYTYARNIAKSTGRQDAVMVVVLDYQKILENIQILDGSVYVLHEGWCLGRSEFSNTGGYLDMMENLEEKEYQYVEQGDEKLIFCKLDEHDIYLLNVIPKGAFMERLGHAKLILLWYIVLCLLVGSMLSGILTRWNYSPIDELLQMTQKGTYRSDQKEESFQAIKSSVEKLIQAYDGLEEEKLSRKSQLWANRMKRILQNNRFAMISEAEFGRLTSHFVYDGYLLMDYNISDISDIFIDEENILTEDTWHLISFIIHNVCEELLDKRYPYIAGAWGMDYVFLLNVNSKMQKEVYEDLRQIAKKIGLFMKESYGLNLWINISGIHEGRSGIALCRDEVTDMNLFRDWEGTSQMVLCYHDMASQEDVQNVEIYYKEKQARDLIRKHEYDAAITLLTQLYKGVAEGEEAVEEVEKEPAGNRPNPCSMQQVARYIEEHYTDSTLSAGLLADLFGMSQSNLSQTFKRKMNIGLLDYINRTRLEKAKVLLSQGMTVKDTAEAVGYYTTRPLIRVFYSIEGMSPVEYRAKYIQKQEEGKS